LRFSPTGWAKLLYFRDAGLSEVGGFGISAADDLLYIENVELVRQVCDVASVVFDDQAVADYFDRQVDAGRKPEQFARAWLHTHPGSSPQPSSTDENTFARVFGKTEWALMFILARGGRTYARMQFHVGPGGSVLLPVDVDYHKAFAASDHETWQAEYRARVQIEVQIEPWPPAPQFSRHSKTRVGSPGLLMPQADWPELWDELFDDKLVDACTDIPEGGFDDDEY
jgi:proteasome lid subunit RPN8/RPN11